MRQRVGPRPHLTRPLPDHLGRHRRLGAPQHHAHTSSADRAYDETSGATVPRTLTAPDLTDRLVHRRGWGSDRFERLDDAMAEALLGPGR